MKQLLLSIITKLSIRTKFLVIFSGIFVPIVFLIYVFINTRNESIDFGQEEIWGNEYLIPLNSILNNAIVLKVNQQRSAMGIGGKGSDSEKSKIVDGLTKVKEVDDLYSDAIPTTDELKAIETEFTNAVKSGTGSYEQINESYGKFIGATRAAMSKVGDQSNLILDPDLDSYYLMDAVLLKLPETQDLLGKTAALAEAVSVRGSITPSERVDLTVLVGLLESNLIATRDGIKVAFGNNPAGNLTGALGDELTAFEEKVTKYANLVKEAVLGDSLTTQQSTLASTYSEANDVSFVLWNQTSNELQGLLVARIDSISSVRNITLILIFVLLAASGLFSYFSVKYIIEKVLSVEKALADYSKDGVKDVALQTDSSDEFGHIATSFNALVGIINQKIEELDHERNMNALKVQNAIQNSEAEKQYLAQVVQDLIEAHQQFASGMLTIELQPRKADDIAKVYYSFNEALVSIKDALRKINDSFYSTQIVIQEVTGTADIVAEGARQQMEQTTSIASAIEEMAITVTENSQNASAAVHVAKAAGDSAKKGGEIIKNAIGQMNTIANIVIDSSDKISELGKSSEQIGEIIQVINDIADQTNLLALNAAIEAARAGEQGRGFAVVADEVRKLAERTSKATNEIAGMIKKIQSDTGSAVESMTQGTSQVEMGRKLTSEAEHSLDEIIVSTGKVTELITNLASASEQQAKASEDIARGVHEINSIAERTSNNIVLIGNMINDMNQQSDQMSELLAESFTLDESGQRNNKLRSGTRKQLTY